MFGSTNPFGQSSSSPFGQSSVFGQTSSVTSNPFSPRPFGSPFGSPTGNSIFGSSTSTGVFGQPSSPLTSPAFGASSTPAFGASSTTAFGASSSNFGSSSIFGAKPTFGAFGSSTPSQTSPFGGTLQQTQPTFGSSLFGSTTTFGASQPAFGATSTPAFGSTSSPAFGATSTPAFGATSTPTFGATTMPAFGATSTPAFGSTSSPLFGGTGTAFGVSSAPAFGSTPAFGASSTSIFGSSSTPAFGATSTPAFGSSSAPAFGASSTPSFGFSSTPAFGQTTSAFGSTPFGSTPPFGAQSSPFGTPTATPTFGSPGFGQQAFGGQQGGSRVAPYTPTPEVDGGTGTQAAGKLESISAMPVYKEKSHEELRWEDYQRGDKGGPSTAGQAAGAFGFPSAQTSPFGSTNTFGQTPAFSSATTNPFGQKPTFGSTGFGASSTPSFSSPFGVSSSSPFGSTTASTTPSLFGSSTPAFGASSTPAFGASSTPAFGASSTPAFGASSISAFGASSTPAFGASSTPAFGSSSTPAFGTISAPAFGASSTPSLFGGSTSSIFGSSPFGASSAAAATPAFGSTLTFGGTQSSGLFQSSPSFGQTPSLFGQPSTGFGQTTSAFGSSLFSTPSTGFGGGLFSTSTSSLVPSSSPLGFGQSAPSLSSPFQPAPPALTSGTFPFGGFGQTQLGASGFGSMSNVFGQGILGQSAATQTSMMMQPAPVTSPFGTLPAMPQMSIGRGGSAPSVQYGISSMPVAEKPVSVRISSLLTPRHITQRRIKLHPRKYHPKTDGPLVPFFSEDEEGTSTPKADALFIPRENPRALIVHPIEKWPPHTSTMKPSVSRDGSAPACENGKATGEPSASARNGSAAEDHDVDLLTSDACGYEVTQVENGYSGEQDISSSLRSLEQRGVHPDDRAQNGKESTCNIISGHRAGEAAVVYEHGADIEAIMPKLRHPEYYTEPLIQELAAKERAHPGFCCLVRDFVVGRRGYGSIKFDGETDVRRLDLESIVQFSHREVIVYKDESKKPPVGQGLNKPAEVTLLNIKCINKKTGQQYTDERKVERYKEMLMKKAEEQGAEFVSYDALKGEWKFRVKHFSRYEFGGEEDQDASLW
ncbi:hypothetical protein Taro_030714 [Colocasia esculenta]|uniref:Nucleoporin autopeptidase n=1 Tax=Colocasia esculenta TaxID=4460 RepID=A0A843VSP3_COLES|nr:hypothetical protein [Colocasia esculenta]